MHYARGSGVACIWLIYMLLYIIVKHLLELAWHQYIFCLKGLVSLIMKKYQQNGQCIHKWLIMLQGNKDREYAFTRWRWNPVTILQNSSFAIPGLVFYIYMDTECGHSYGIWWPSTVWCWLHSYCDLFLWLSKVWIYFLQDIFFQNDKWDPTEPHCTSKY